MRRNFIPTILYFRIVNDLFINKNGITIKNLAVNLKVDYKNVYDAVEKLIKLGVIDKQKLGNYNICRLNYSNENIVECLKGFNYYIRIREFKKKHPTEYSILKETIDRWLEKGMPVQFLSPKSPVQFLFICMIFGSYAKGSEGKNSDIDIFFLSSSITDFKSTLEEVNAPYQKRFHIENQQIMDFIRDLNKKNSISIATEVYKEPPIVLYGDDIFFRIMVEVNKLW